MASQRQTLSGARRQRPRAQRWRLLRDQRSSEPFSPRSSQRMPSPLDPASPIFGCSEPFSPRFGGWGGGGNHAGESDGGGYSYSAGSMASAVGVRLRGHPSHSRCAWGDTLSAAMWGLSWAHGSGGLMGLHQQRRGTRGSWWASRWVPKWVRWAFGGFYFWFFNLFSEVGIWPPLEIQIYEDVKSEVDRLPTSENQI